MENVFLTSLTTPEVRQLFREELKNFFAEGLPYSPQAPTPTAEVELDISSLAKYLKCSIPTIHKLKREGVIPFYRLGRKVYFKKSEIDSIAKVKLFKGR